MNILDENIYHVQFMLCLNVHSIGTEFEWEEFTDQNHMTMNPQGFRTMHLCYILTFDPAQKYYSKVIHRKEVTHSNGQ